MRKATVTIGTLLLVGAAVALVNCGGDDSSPTGGSGASGGTGGSGGSTGGSGGSGGSTGGAAGTGGMPDGSATGGSSGSAGKGGSAGAAGSGGSAGKGGSAGSGGSAGAAGKAGAAGSGGAAGSAGDGGPGADGGQCPAMQPPALSPCDLTVDCVYGMVTCTCSDPGPNGIWLCSGGPPGDAGGGGDGGMCPAMQPDFGDPCPDGGYLGPCVYDGGHSECTCDPTGQGWSCIRH